MADEMRLLSLPDNQTPQDFLRQLVLSMVSQKRASCAFGETEIRLKWKNGELTSAEITDGVAVKFKPNLD